MKHKKAYRVISFILAVCLLISTIEFTTAQAATKKITVAMARSFGLANSSSYKLQQSKIELANVQYEQAVEALRLKKKNQTTFRWSPLLSFHLPESLNLSENYEYQYEPLELQSKIDTMEHKLSDLVYEINYNVSSLFVKVYVLQEKISYNEERLVVYESTLNKNKRRLALGLASQTDIDSMESKVTSVQTTLSSDKSSYEAQKKKLSDLIGVDVTSGYTFEDPFVEGEISRDILDDLTTYTLEHDQTYYEARIATSNALLALNTNYSLMKQQYGSNITMLDGYIDQIKNGESVNTSAFKLRYNEFLKKIDEPWTGYKKIWFVKIPKEWFKGEIDGVRYVEDEPYVLYESALEYQDAVKEQESTKTDISNEVTDTFENYVSTKKAMESLEQQQEDKKAELDKDKKLNLLGKMTYDEYASVQDEYESIQIELMEAKADYSELLYSFDRLTCGKISEMLGLATFAVSADSTGGYSYAVENEGSGVYYYIHQMAAENVFEFGLTVSEDADVALTDFELWVDGVQVGSRTPLSSVIRHLSLDLDKTDRVFVRIYNNDTFVDDCDIDPTVYSGKLDITSDYTIVSNESDLVGHYGIETDNKGMMVINIIPEMDTTYAYYNIMTESGDYLQSEDKISIKQDFKYLQLAQSSLEELIINFYDEGGNLVYKARFKDSDKTIRKITED